MIQGISVHLTHKDISEVVDSRVVEITIKAAGEVVEEVEEGIST